MAAMLWRSSSLRRKGSGANKPPFPALSTCYGGAARDHGSRHYCLMSNLLAVADASEAM
jgi:hypothetical protein